MAGGKFSQDREGYIPIMSASMVDTQQHRLPRELAGGHERREEARVRLCKGVKLLLTGSGRFIGGHTLDISERGMKVRLPGTIAVDAGADIEVMLDSHAEGVASRADMVRAKVMWAERDAIYQPTQIAGLRLVTPAKSAATASNTLAA